MTISANDRRLVQDSFERVREQSAGVGLLFYGRLFELDPSARRLFHNDLAAQVRKLFDTLDIVVSSLDRFDSLRPRLVELGRLHAEIGVRRDQYEAVTAALLWAIGQALDGDFDSATRRAWQAALDAVVGAMTGEPPVS